MKYDPKIAIIILNYLSYRDTLNMVKQINNILNYNNYIIIVVDNCSPNESYEELNKVKNQLKFILLKSDKNGGYAYGNNIGIRFSYKMEADYSWILNNDIILSDRNVLSRMIDLMKLNSSVGVVSPRILKYSGDEEYPFIERPTCWEMSLGYLRYARKRKQHFTKNRKIYRPQGCCMLIKNSDLKLINEMDESTFLYCEEDILAERLLQINKECWFCAEAEVIHNHSKTVYSVMKKNNIAKLAVESYIVYLKKYRKIKNSIMIALICTVKYIVMYFSY